MHELDPLFFADQVDNGAEEKGKEDQPIIQEVIL